MQGTVGHFKAVIRWACVAKHFYQRFHSNDMQHAYLIHSVPPDIFPDGSMH